MKVYQGRNTVIKEQLHQVYTHAHTHISTKRNPKSANFICSVEHNIGSILVVNLI
jgi:hypothetical protein